MCNWESAGHEMCRSDSLFTDTLWKTSIGSTLWATMRELYRLSRKKVYSSVGSVHSILDSLSLTKYVLLTVFDCSLKAILDDSIIYKINTKQTIRRYRYLIGCVYFLLWQSVYFSNNNNGNSNCNTFQFWKFPDWEGGLQGDTIYSVPASLKNCWKIEKFISLFSGKSVAKIRANILSVWRLRDVSIVSETESKRKKFVVFLLWIIWLCFHCCSAFRE